MAGRPSSCARIGASILRCSSSLGHSGAARKASSVRSRPTPSAPASKAVVSSAAPDTFARTRTEWPSSVTDGSSRLAIASARLAVRRLSASVAASILSDAGDRNTSPSLPSTTTRLPGVAVSKRVADPDDHRDPKRARHDRRVGRDAPGRERDPGDAQVQLGDLGRPQVRRNQDLPAVVAGAVVLRLGVEADQSGGSAADAADVVGALGEPCIVDRRDQLRLGFRGVEDRGRRRNPAVGHGGQDLSLQ